MTPHPTTPHHTTPHHNHTIPCHATPHHTIPHHTTPHHIISYNTIATPCHATPDNATLYCSVSHHTTPHHPTSHHIPPPHPAPLHPMPHHLPTGAPRASQSERRLFFHSLSCAITARPSHPTALFKVQSGFAHVPQAHPACVMERKPDYLLFTVLGGGVHAWVRGGNGDFRTVSTW